MLPWPKAVVRTKKNCKIQSFNFWDLSVELAYPGGEIDKNSQPRDESAKPCYRGNRPFETNSRENFQNAETQA